MILTREWAMPAGDTFSVPAINAFVRKWLKGCEIIVDPFARNSKFGTITNDLNPETTAQYHMEARDFLEMVKKSKVRANAVIFDPPYSPRQVAQLYRNIGRDVTQQDTQNSVLNKRVREQLSEILLPGGVVLSFGWNSCGFGKDFEINEIKLIAHGGAHNDTICMASRKKIDA